MTNEDIIETFKKLTPENRVKFWNKYFELLAEQEREKTNENNNHL